MIVVKYLNFVSSCVCIKHEYLSNLSKYSIPIASSEISYIKV